MNVLFLSELFHPHGSGAELATYLYARLLSRAGLNIVVVTNRFDGEPGFSEDGAFKIYRVPIIDKHSPTGGSAKYSALMRLDVLFSSLVRRHVKWADVVYIPRFWYSAALLAKGYGKPVITHLHDYLPVCPLSNVYDIPNDIICAGRNLACLPGCIYAHEKVQGRSSEKVLVSILLNSTVGRCFSQLVKLSDAVICVSRAQEKIVSAKLPSLRNKMHVIYNPLPEIQYVSLEGDGLAYFGGPSIFKGFHVLCKALKGLKGRRITVSATGFKNVEEQTMKFPNGTILEKRPWVDREALERIYRSIRAVIIPSVWSEPLPYVTYEALLKGRLVIASNIGGIPEQVLNYAGCFLFTPGKHLELADKIDHVSSMSREEVSEIGQRNRKMMLNQNINEKSLCSFLKILDDL